MKVGLQKLLDTWMKWLLSFNAESQSCYGEMSFNLYQALADLTSYVTAKENSQSTKTECDCNAVLVSEKSGGRAW
jgi:hypothetical protein